MRQWIARDDYLGLRHRKDHTLRGVGTNIGVWVANDLAFPAGDGRTQIGSSTQITDGGATYTTIAGDKTVGGPLGPAL